MLVSQSARHPPLFSMPSKLLILHGEAKSYSFTVSCVPESVFDWLLIFLSNFIVISFVRSNAPNKIFSRM